MTRTISPAPGGTFAPSRNPSPDASCPARPRPRRPQYIEARAPPSVAPLGVELVARHAGGEFGSLFALVRPWRRVPLSRPGELPLRPSRPRRAVAGLGRTARLKSATALHVRASSDFRSRLRGPPYQLAAHTRNRLIASCALVLIVISEFDPENDLDVVVDERADEVVLWHLLLQVIDLAGVDERGRPLSVDGVDVNA